MRSTQARTYRNLPSLPGPVTLDDWRFSIIRPVGRTNLILNPSVETNTTGYTAVGGSIARSTTFAYHGAYSLAITPTAATTDGAYYTTSSLTSGTVYAVSVKVLGTPGRPYRLAVASNAGVVLQTQAFTATGQWQWITMLHAATATATHRIYVAKNGGTQTNIFYMDGLQLEACAANEYYPTTYIDGDQLGLLGAVELPPFYWTGTPHASTSVRSGQTRAGGRVVPLSFYRFTPTNIQGLGMAPVQQITTPFAQLDGSQFLDTRKTDRGVTITGRWQTATPYDRQRRMAALMADLDRDLIATRQPLTILAEPLVKGKPTRAPLFIPALSYVEGLSGDLDSLPTGESIISFTQYQPRINGGDTGAALTVQGTLTQDLWQRTAAGVWSWLGGSQAFANPVSGAVPLAFAQTPDGYVYIAGSYNAGGGVAGSDGITRFRDGVYSGVSGAANAAVRSIDVLPNGNLVLAGDFTTLNSGGVAANRIAIWNGATYSALGTGLNGVAFAVVADRLGNIYVGGSFTLAGGVANTVRIAKWDGSVWTPLSTGADANVLTLAIGPDGTTLYAGGSFTTIGGVSVTGIAKWNGSAWSALAGGVSGGGADVLTLAFAPNGTLYAGGDFTTIGGISASNIASWNGVQWSALGSGTSGGNVQSLAINTQTGLLYVGGAFTAAGGLSGNNLAAWNGSAWVRPDALLSTTYPIVAMLYRQDGSLIVATTVVIPAASFVVAVPTSVTAPSTVGVSPTLIITGPSSGTATISQLLNTTSQTFIYLNTTISAGEIITLVLDPQRFSYTSSTRGDIIGEILPGSNLAGFILQPGINTISFLSSAASVTAVLFWPNDLASLEDGWTK